MAARTVVQFAAVVSCLGFFAIPGLCKAEIFQFDLTDAAGADFNNLPESLVDLEIEFAAIDNAAISLSGVFTPGLATPVTVPEHSGPTVPADDVNLIVRLGAEGSAWIEKDVYAIQALKGQNGFVEFSLPLHGAVPTSGPIPTLLPGGELPPNFDFLMDGCFGLSTGWLHALPSLYQELESPQFELTEFTLEVDGTAFSIGPLAVPEPSTGTWALLALLSLIVSTRYQLFGWAKRA